MPRPHSLYLREGREGGVRIRYAPTCHMKGQMLPQESRPPLVCVSGRVFQTRNGASGSLELLSATMSSPFEQLSPSNPPSNRMSPCLIPFSATSFLMLGGDGPGITSFEVWLFDIPSCSWRLLNGDCALRHRAGHAAASVIRDREFVVYVFGGVTGLEFCRDVLVLAVRESGFSACVIPEGEGWPMPRWHASLTACQSKVMMFGGEDESGKCLNDFWEFDGAFFEKCPFWKSVGKGGLPGRRGHESWTEGRDLFVAGGAGEKGPLDDVWKWYEGAWHQTMIFVTQHPVFACELGLCEVGEKLEKVAQRTPFAALDGLFEDLRKEEKRFSDRRVGEESKLAMLKGKLIEIRGQSSALDTYRSGAPSEKVHEALANFSKERRDEMQAQVVKLREELSKVVQEIVDEYPMCVNNGVRPSQAAREIAIRMGLKLQEEKRNQEATEKERADEMKIGEETLILLRERVKDSPEVEVDPANFDSFMKIAKEYGVRSEESQNALDSYYGMQLRCYHHLAAVVQERKEDIAEARRRLPILEQTINRLSEKLMNRFTHVSKLKKKLERWTRGFAVASQEKERSEQYQQEREKPGNETLTREIEELRDKLSKSLLEIVQTHGQDIETIWTKSNALVADIDGITADVAAPILATRAPAIETLMYKISNV